MRHFNCTHEGIQMTGGKELLPDDIKYHRQDKFVVNSDGHVARLVERRRHRPHSVAQVHRPQEEEELSYGARMRKKR